jgi:hypothetical protein
MEDPFLQTGLLVPREYGARRGSNRAPPLVYVAAPNALPEAQHIVAVPATVE